MRILYHPKRILGFEPYVAPTGFDRKAQPVDIYDVFNKYYKTNSDAKYIYSVLDTATTSTPNTGTSYRYGYTSGGVDYVVDLYNNTQITQSYSGNTTTIKVASTAGFPASGTLYIGNGQSFIYTTITDGTTFTGASQSITQSSGSQVYCSKYTITWIGTKRWIIVNHITTSTMMAAITDVNAPWLYCGDKIYSVAAQYVNLKYIHIHKIDNITLYGGTSFRGNKGLVGVLHLSRNPLVTIIQNECFFMHGTGSVTGFTGELLVPSNIKEIGAVNFVNSGITSLVCEEGVTSIGVSAFTGSLVLASIDLPNSLTTIGIQAFYNCPSLTGTLTIPVGVTTIGAGAFAYTYFDHIENNSSNFGVWDEVLYDITGGTKKEANYSARGYSGTLTLQGDTTKILAYCAANNHNRTGSLTIPDSVTSVGDYAFMDCIYFTGNLVMETTASVMTTIGIYAFSGCYRITGTLTLSSVLQIIGASAFAIIPFTGTLNIPNTMVTISEGAFLYPPTYIANFSAITGGSTACPVEDNVVYCINGAVVQAITSARGYSGTLTLKSTTTRIGMGCFYNNSNRTGTLVLPNSVTFMGGGAFYGCSGFTGDITIPSSWNGISILPYWGGARIFQGCSGIIGTLTVNNPTLSSSGADLGGLSATTALVLCANYSGTYLNYSFSSNFSGASLDASSANITDGTKTWTIGATNKARMSAGAIAAALARGITIV